MRDKALAGGLAKEMAKNKALKLKTEILKKKVLEFKKKIFTHNLQRSEHSYNSILLEVPPETNAEKCKKYRDNM